MKYSIWGEGLMLKSYEFVKKLAALGIEFVLMGGWAVYFLTKYHMSKDIDLVIRDREFWKLKNYITSLGGKEKTTSLPKTGFVVEDVELDVYTESKSNLIMPVKDIFSENYFMKIEGINVLRPEVLLILKIQAEKERTQTMKGFKDRCDIFAILLRSEPDREMLNSLSSKYNCQDIMEYVMKMIKGSQKEFEYVLQKPVIPSKLKRLKRDLLAKFVIPTSG